MVDTGEIFHPLRWSPQQAVQLLKDVPALESAGVVGRMPASWRMNRPARPQVKATAGGTHRRKQTKTVKQLRADTRIALTGTPIESRLSDLWSIFDFINPELLGSSKEFSSFVKRFADRPHNPYGPLRDLVRPYILRRQ